MKKHKRPFSLPLTSISALFFFKSAHDGANISTNAPVLHLATHSVVPFRFQPIGQNCRQSQDSIQYQRVLDGGAESEEDEINTVRRSGTRNGRDQAEPSGPQKHRRPMTRRAHIGWWLLFRLFVSVCVLVCVLRRSVMLYYTPPPFVLEWKRALHHMPIKGEERKKRTIRGFGGGGETEKIDLLNCGEISQWVGRGLRDPARKKSNNRNPTFE